MHVAICFRLLTGVLLQSRVVSAVHVASGSRLLTAVLQQMRVVSAVHVTSGANLSTAECVAAAVERPQSAAAHGQRAEVSNAGP